jgi:hypothetical protein
LDWRQCSGLLLVFLSHYGVFAPQGLWQQQLLYTGPLATDLLCGDKASFLDSVIHSTTLLPGFWLNGEGSACRCIANSSLKKTGNLFHIINIQ